MSSNRKHFGIVCYIGTVAYSCDPAPAIEGQEQWRENFSSSRWNRGLGTSLRLTLSSAKTLDIGLSAFKSGIVGIVGTSQGSNPGEDKNLDKP